MGTSLREVIMGLMGLFMVLLLLDPTEEVRESKQGCYVHRRMSMRRMRQYERRQLFSFSPER